MPVHGAPAIGTTKQLGDTGLTVSPLGLGLAAVGRPGYITLGRDHDLGRARSVAELEQRTFALLDAAWALGVRYVDAARSYGQAEAFLGSWLERRGDEVDALTIGSKWGYTYTARWRIDAERHEVKEHSPALLRQQWPESLALLGHAPDLYQVHSVTPGSPALDDDALIRALAVLKGQGVRIGLSTSGPEQWRAIDAALTVEVDGVRLYDCVQATWNLLERSAGDALSEARAAGVGVIVKEALANGRLTTHGASAVHSAQQQRVAAAAQALAVGIDAIAIAAALAQPWCDVVLSGAVSVTQLHANAQALGIHWDDELSAACDGLAEPAHAYWRTRAELPWR